MMNIEGDVYTITFQDGVIKMSGKLSLMVEGYEKLEKMFKEIFVSKPATLALDIRDLEYLNSSGIKTICVDLILAAADIDNLRLKILCSKNFTWQKETVPSFENLMDKLEITFD